MLQVCRDCGSYPQHGARCAACGSPRVSPAPADLGIAHVDCDAFYAAIEKRDDPSLREKPVIVGGGKRGVVATACYVARIFGVKSAMPMFKALKACPHAVVIKPNMAKYKAVSQELRGLMDQLTPVVEPLSIDEAFLDLRGTERLHGAPPAVSLARFALVVEQRIGITVSIGLSGNKFLAKFASDMNKPRGFTLLPPEDAPAILAPLPAQRLWGVGAKAAQKLARHGFATIGDIQRASLERLAAAAGSDAARLHRLSRGEDARVVHEERLRKSLSSERTFEDDIADLPSLTAHLRAVCDRLGQDLRRKDWAGRTVTLKLKTGDFRLITRSQTLDTPAQTAAKLLETALPLLKSVADGRQAFRLLGVGVHVVTPDDPAPLLPLEPRETKQLHLEQAMDALRRKYGPGAIKQG
jgi:DNA polymerase IV